MGEVVEWLLYRDIWSKLRIFSDISMEEPQVHHLLEPDGTVHQDRRIPETVDPPPALPVREGVITSSSNNTCPC